MAERDRYPYMKIRELADLAPCTPDAAIAGVLDQPGASAQLSYDFLGFMHVYRAAAAVLPKRARIVDFGAATAIQSWYFADFALYTAVQPASRGAGGLAPVRELPACAMVARTSAQEYLETHGVDAYRDFIICSAVPDDDVLGAVRASGAPFIWWYPGAEAECRGEWGAAVASALSGRGA